ncbi:hypothetical protein OAK16_04520 [Verrucomicrobia bacterium]|nr:hypothetical protein [Verrucomicrobiota bacterium]
MISGKDPICRKCGHEELLKLQEPKGWLCFGCEVMWTSVPLLEWVPNSSDDVFVGSGHFFSTIINGSFGTKLLSRHFCGYCHRYCKGNDIYCSTCGIKFNGKIIPKKEVRRWYLEFETSSKLNGRILAYKPIHPQSPLLILNYSEGKKNGEQLYYFSQSSKLQKESIYKDGELISKQFWNFKGEPVDSWKETYRN